MKRLGSPTPEDRRWRAEVLDVRGHLFIQCKEHREVAGGKRAAKRTDVYMHADTGSMSGGERQRFTAFIMAAALSYQLGIAEQGFTTYGTVMMDEAFVLASEEFAGAGHQGAARVRVPAAAGRPGKRDRPVPAPGLRHRNPPRQAHQPLRRADGAGDPAPPRREGEWRSEANPVDIVLR